MYTPLPHFPQCTIFAAQILLNLCFSFFLGIIAVPKQIENNAYAKFWGANKVHYGKCGSGIHGAKSTFWGGVGRRGWRFLIETGKIISLLSL